MFHKWTGRIDENDIGKRFHQVVKNINVDELKKVTKRSFGLVGFESDEGVRRNNGRLGAAKAPNAIRTALANIAYHFEDENIIDIGNIACTDNDLEGAQRRLGESVSQLIEHKYTPVILGGGHETLYGHYLGAREALGPDKKVGVINLDAHFDLREDEQPSSGTMFRQILECDNNAEYLCVGIQELGNTEQLFLTAEQHKVEYVLERDIQPLENTFMKISEFANRQDHIIYTICTDVINQAFAPGVSAPAPFGLEPSLVKAITNHVVQQSNFLSMDVSEVNPMYDIDSKTSRLISYLIGEALANLNIEAGTLSNKGMGEIL